MRVARIVFLAALVAMPVALAAAMIPPGGQLKTPEDWKWRLDEPAAMAAGGKLDAGQWWFVAMPPGWHVTMGPGGVAYRPEYRASGRFVVESELFLFPDSSDEGVGIFVGGQSLGGRIHPSMSAKPVGVQVDAIEQLAIRKTSASKTVGLVFGVVVGLASIALLECANGDCFGILQ